MRHELSKYSVSTYFEKRGTVSEWWEPESERVKPKQRQCYIEERLKVLELANPKGKVILDLCTGKGRFAISFAEAGAEKVLGIDISRDMLEIARERARSRGMEGKIDFEVGTADRIEYDDLLFDASVCLQALMHVPHPDRTLGELARVTKHDGLIIVDHENASPYWRMSIGSKRSLGHLLMKSMLFSRLGGPMRRLAERVKGREISRPVMTGVRKGEFKQMIQDSGLELLDMFDFGPSWCPAYFLAVCRNTTDGRRCEETRSPSPSLS